MKRRFHESYGFGAGTPTRAPHMAGIVIVAFVVATLLALALTW